MALERVEICDIFNKEMNKSLCVPSFAHGYSLSIEYMRKWFLSKFDKEYFKTVYVNDSHVFNDFRSMDSLNQLKRLKPSLAIIPQIDFEFDREKVDTFQFDLNMYTARSRYEDSFFKDKAKNVFMNIGMKVDMINFIFKIRVSTKAQQIDLAQWMKMAFRIGSTHGDYIDMDIHIPYNLMVQLAKDSGFEVREPEDISKESIDWHDTSLGKKIVNITEFLSYLNNNSVLPFLYKLRCINGHDEFFIRMQQLYIHLSTPSLSVDEGEREGQLMNNYIIEMPIAMRIPSPMFYVYFSSEKHIEFKSMEKVEGAIPIFTAQLMEIPEVNEKGWNQLLYTEYVEENVIDLLSIDFSDLLSTSKLKSGDQYSIGDVIKYNNSIFLSSDLFIEIKLYNDHELVEFNIDWNTMLLTTIAPVNEITTYISLYVDLDYVAKVIIDLGQMNKTRID